MRKNLLSEEGLIDPPLLVRMGINLGPVRLVKDINGQPNIVGDGINVAQRVMGFAEPGQILVSRSYYEAASRLSQEYAGMFHFEGSRTDKHVREHEVYAIGYPGDLTAAQQAADPKEETKFSKALVNIRVNSKVYWDASVVRYHELAAHIRETFNHASGQQKTLYVGVALIPLLLMLLLVVKLAHKPEAPLNDLTKAAELNSPTAVDAAKSGVSPASPAPAAATSSAKRTSPAHEQKLSGQQKKEKKASKTPHAAKEKTPGSAAQGTVTLTIKPWGEVYLDGKWADVSPPLTKLQVPVGAHVIEIRNTTFPVYKQSIKIKAGEKININHKFSN
jgi:hypothetical protein